MSGQVGRPPLTLVNGPPFTGTLHYTLDWYNVYSTYSLSSFFIYLISFLIFFCLINISFRKSKSKKSCQGIIGTLWDIRTLIGPKIGIFKEIRVKQYGQFPLTVMKTDFIQETMTKTR